MRVDTTVVESNIHYPTDSSLLGDGVRVLTRSMRKITELAGKIGAKLRHRSRSVKWRVLEIARAARGKAPPSRDRLETAYGSLLQATGRVVGQAKRFSREIGDGVKRCTAIVQQTALEGHRQVLDVMVPRVQQVMRQTMARIFRGDTRSEGKIVSIFEPSTEVIRKGKAAKPTEFGKLVKRPCTTFLAWAICTIRSCISLITAGPSATPQHPMVLASGILPAPTRVKSRYTRLARTSRSRTA